MSTTAAPPRSVRIAGSSYLTVKLWAMYPREVILRKMAPDQPLHTRIFHALLLWSVCAPGRSDVVICKDKHGDPITVGGRTVPACQEDIRRLLDLEPGMRGEVSRQFARLIQEDYLRQDAEGWYYLNPTPDARPLPEEEDRDIACSRNIKIVNLLITKDQLPSDPAARGRAVSDFEEIQNDFLADMRAAKARAMERARAKCVEHQIEVNTRVHATSVHATNGNGDTQRNGASSRKSIIIDSETTREKLASQPAPQEPATPEPPHREPIRELVRERFPDSTYADSENDKTHAALRGAPLERLRRRMAERAREGPYGPGVIALLAGEVGDAWTREQETQSRAAPANERNAAIRHHQANLLDPDTPETEKVKSRAFLREQGVELLE